MKNSPLSSYFSPPALQRNKQKQLITATLQRHW